MLKSSNFLTYVCLFSVLDVEPCQLCTKESEPDKVVRILLILCCDFAKIIYIGAEVHFYPLFFIV